MKPPRPSGCWSIFASAAVACVAAQPVFISGIIGREVDDSSRRDYGCKINKCIIMEIWGMDKSLWVNL